MQREAWHDVCGQITSSWPFGEIMISRPTLTVLIVCWTALGGCKTSSQARTKPVVENEIFGNNAAIGCHLSNYAYFNKAIAVWDGKAGKIVKG